MKKEEYKDEFGAKSYVEAVLGARKVQECKMHSNKDQKLFYTTNRRKIEDKKLEADSKINKESENGWQMVSRRKNKSIKINKWATIFVAKILIKAKSKEVWDFFDKACKLLDIILLKKRDVDGNIIGFVKTSSEKEAIRILERLETNKFLGARLDLKLSSNNSKNKIIDREKEIVKVDRVEKGKKV